MARKAALDMALDIVDRKQYSGQLDEARRMMAIAVGERNAAREPGRIRRWLARRAKGAGMYGSPVITPNPPPKIRPSFKVQWDEIHSIIGGADVNQDRMV
ncbi:MAG: hypothetical protein KAT70_08745 [Thermoplasmata archaeon]|nr:hypothetical protein [Thermoplasmata archaeon]